MTADGVTKYMITSYKGDLKTPYCSYKDLMVIEAYLQDGLYQFYYKKGHGYVGATKDGELLSYLMSESKETD